MHNLSTSTGNGVGIIEREHTAGPCGKRAIKGTHSLVPEVALNPALRVGPGHKGLHEGNIGIHGCPSSCCNLSDPHRLAKLLVQTAGGALDRAQVCSICVVAEGVNSIPGSWRVAVQRLHQQTEYLHHYKGRGFVPFIEFH